jgi:hypothetical protein
LLEFRHQSICHHPTWHSQTWAYQSFPIPF